MLNSLRPHGLQHTRPSCPSSTLEACSNSCLSSLWCHPTISSSVVPFFSCLQSFPASGFFPISQFLHQVVKVLELHLHHQSIHWIFRTNFFRIDWFDLLIVQATLKSLLQHHISKALIQPRILGWWPITSPADLPEPGIKQWSPALQADSLPTEVPGKPQALLRTLARGK